MLGLLCVFIREGEDMAVKSAKLASQDLVFLSVPWELAFQHVVTSLCS